MSGRFVVRAQSTQQQPFPVYSSVQFPNVAIQSTGNDISLDGLQIQTQAVSVPSVSCSYLTGNGSQLSFDAPFAIQNILVTDEEWNVTTMSQVDSNSASVYYLVQGVGFLPGTQVFVGSSVATSVEYTSSTILRVRGPALPDGTYDVRVVLPNLREKTLVNGLAYDPVPFWITPPSLGAVYGPFSIPLVAQETNNSELTFSSANLPVGLLLTLQGTLEGNNASNTNTVYSFDVTARDAQDQVISRQFVLTFSPPPIWQNKTAYNIWSGDVYLQLAASEASDSPIVFGNVDALPGNLSLVNGMLQGNIVDEDSATYTVELQAIDLEQQIALRTFTIQYNAYDVPTLGLIGRYDGQSVQLAQWLDVSGQENHAAIGGTVTTDQLNGHTILTGTTSTTIVWPTGILPSTFTLFHYTRYAPSGTKRRIFAGDTKNWLNGFYNGSRGIAYHNGWIGGVSSSTCPDDWVLSASTATTYRANKSLIGTSGAGSPNYDRLTINSGIYGQTSDWMCAEVLVYNRILTDDEVRQAEDYLFHKYVPLIEPTFALSARSLNYANNTTLNEWQTVGEQVRVATAFAVGGASLPTYNATEQYVQLYGGTSTFGSYFNLGETTWNIATNGGFTFVGYIRFSSVEYYERIFDFGNGPSAENILFARRGTENVLRAEVQSPTVTYDRSGIINNTWQTVACRLVEESPNVWRWSMWIDGRWTQSGTTSTSISDRTLANSFIGRSNWSNDDYSALALRELWFYDRPLSDQEVWRVICKVQEGYPL